MNGYRRCTYTVQYYSPIKKTDILPFTATWVDLEGIMPSEVSHTEKNKYYVSLIGGIEKIQQARE